MGAPTGGFRWPRCAVAGGRTWQHSSAAVGPQQSGLTELAVLPGRCGAINSLP
jgi:hypothetical protein